jgi:hypothetical protein
LIVALAVFAVALAAPSEDLSRKQRAIYSTYGGLVGSPLAYSATPYLASPYSNGYYAGVPAISAYSSYPAYSGVYGGIPAVQYY